MEKNTKELLAEILEEAKELNARIEALKAKVAEYEALPAEEPADAVADFSDIEITVGELPEPEEISPRDPSDLGRDDSPVISSEVEKSPEIPVEDDLPEAEPAPKPKAKPKAEPKPKPEPKPEPAAKPYAWMLDVPGVSVKNIRSAISLQDRALFIKTLFKEDFALYDATISALNAMMSPEEAADYVKENFPDWNLRSDIVYCFMMAVRKKLG